MMNQQLDAGQTAEAAPMSFSRSAQRMWRMTEVTDSMWLKVPIGIVAALGVVLAWCVVAVVNAAWAIFVWPVQRLRSRRRAVEDLGTQSVKHAGIVR